MTFPIFRWPVGVLILVRVIPAILILEGVNWHRNVAA